MWLRFIVLEDVSKKSTPSQIRMKLNFRKSYMCIDKYTYRLAKNFSLVIEGESVPENPFEARLLQKTNHFQIQQ